MLTRALATLTMLLALAAGAEPMPTAAPHRDRARTARPAQLVDDVEGCREPAPTLVPVAPASCTNEGQP